MNGCSSRRIAPRVAIMRATTADERGNLSYEHEGAFLGALDQALAARNNGGIVIAQVKRVVRAGSLKPQHVHVPGDRWSTTSWSTRTRCRPRRPPTTRPSAARSCGPTTASSCRSGARRRSSPGAPRWSCAPASRGQPGLRHLGQRAAHPARGGAARRRSPGSIEQGAVGGVPLLGFAFGCAANADAIVPSPNQFTYFQGGGFDVALLSFLQIDRQRQRQRLEARRQALPDRGLRRLRRHHHARAQARVLRLLHRRRQAARSATAGSHPAGRQEPQAGRQRRARHLQRRMARARGQQRHLRHRALRHRPDADGTDGAGDRAGRRPAARRARPGGFPAAGGAAT